MKVFFQDNEMLNHKRCARAVRVLALALLLSQYAVAQVTERQRPEEWKNLVEGGRFIDLFAPIPTIGKLTEDTWGAANVVPRYIDNGIEDPEWSYWGGNIIQDEQGQYHMYVCRWREDSPKGHMEWSNSEVVHAVADNSLGPFEVESVIGKGHNPEMYVAPDGSHVIYVIDGYYKSEFLSGPWEYKKFDFDPRERPIIEGLSNLTFAQREDGSYLMVCRGGGVWISQDGLSTFEQVSDKRVYPDVDGRFEDPVVWKDSIQYHLIVNDWYGRIAFYLRSPDGVHWKTDPGEAYKPGITKYTDGTEEDWFKYERLKIFQDEAGRAVQANFAVIDTLKKEDQPNDRHSSKNIGIPLVVERQIQILNEDEITPETERIEVLIKSDESLDAQTDVDTASLRLGAPEEVNFGRGSRVLEVKLQGEDLLLVFDGQGNGVGQHDFTAKLLGKDTAGELLYGYAKLPGYEYHGPILSAKPPRRSDDGTLHIEVKNFGLSASASSSLTVEVNEGDRWVSYASGEVSALKPYAEQTVPLERAADKPTESPVQYRVTIGEQEPEVFTVE